MSSEPLHHQHNDQLNQDRFNNIDLDAAFPIAKASSIQIGNDIQHSGTDKRIVKNTKYSSNKGDDWDFDTDYLDVSDFSSVSSLPLSDDSVSDKSGNSEDQQKQDQQKTPYIDIRTTKTDTVNTLTPVQRIIVQLEHHSFSNFDLRDKNVHTLNVLGPTPRYCPPYKNLYREFKSTSENQPNEINGMYLPQSKKLPESTYNNDHILNDHILNDHRLEFQFHLNNIDHYTNKGIDEKQSPTRVDAAKVTKAYSDKPLIKEEVNIFHPSPISVEFLKDCFSEEDLSFLMRL